MIYRLLYKKLGFKKPEIFHEFDSSLPIKDICYVNNIGFVYTQGEDLKVIKDKDSTSELNTEYAIESPMSICFNESFNSIFICCKNGIFEILLGRNGRIIEWIVTQEKDNFMRYFSKSKFEDLKMSCFMNTVAIASRTINRCFILQNSEIKKVIGNGHRNYSITNDSKDCSLSFPMDIVIHDLNNFFVADTNNGCIRNFGDKHNIIIGHPNSEELKPSFMALDRKKGNLYFLSKNYLNSMYLKDRKSYILMENENLKYLVLGKNNVLYTLEETHE